MSGEPPPAAGFGVAGLVVRFGHRLALDRVDLAAPARAVTAVVGGDGAGKTTLLRALAGLLRPAAGTVRRPEQRRIGYLSAGPGVWRDLTVDENLSFTAQAYGLTRDQLDRRGGELLERTGLAGARDRLAGQLSGGMRQKLAFAMAVLHEPALLVLDEPTTGVDPVSRAELWRLLAGAAAGGAAVLLATTYLDEAERASGVLVLDRGRTLLAGAPAALVAGVGGRFVELAGRPAGATAWRRGARWRAFLPAAAGAPAAGRPVEPDLEDVVIVAQLGAERAAAGAA